METYLINQYAENDGKLVTAEDKLDKSHFISFWNFYLGYKNHINAFQSGPITKKPRKINYLTT